MYSIESEYVSLTNKKKASVILGQKSTLSGALSKPWAYIMQDINARPFFFYKLGQRSKYMNHTNEFLYSLVPSSFVM